MSTEAKPTVLITGASGFVGGWLTESLHLTGTATVCAGVRRWSSAGIARLARLPINMVMCDVLDRAQVVEALQGASIVIHSVLGDSRVNVEGTHNLLEAAHQLGTARVVHISTAEVYGPASGDVDERTPYGHRGWAYAKSKIEAEKLCWAYHEKGVPVTIVRPSIVYGPFSQTWIVRVAERLMSGNWHTFEGFGEGYCNLIYISDLVKGIWLAATRDQAVGEAFNLNGPEIITWNEYFRRFNAALGRPDLDGQGRLQAWTQTVSTELARRTLVAAKNNIATPLKKRLIGGSRKTKFGLIMNHARDVIRAYPSVRELTQLYNNRALYMDHKAREQLGFMPEIDVDTALARCVAWLNHHGFQDRMMAVGAD